MAHSGEATIKVVQALLLAKKFTVSQIADITGLKRDSVETVIQRLFNDGLLAKVSKDDFFPQPELVSKKGRPIQYYAVADNSKQKILQNRIDAFSLERSIVEPNKNRPSNPHFLRALSIIESLDLSKVEITDQLYKEASSNLSLARDYEELVSENNDVSEAYIDFVQARLEYLRGEEEDAEDLLKNAKNIFRKHELSEEHVVDEYLISSKLKQAIQEAKKCIANHSYEALGGQLKRLADDINIISNLPSITKSIKDFIAISSSISSLTAAYMNEKNELEKQLHSLLAENQALKLNQKITMEINANLSETVKNISASVNHNLYYPLRPMPESSFIRGEGKLSLPKNVRSISEKMSQNRKAAS